MTPVNAVTNQAGQATFTVTDSTAEVVTYQATDVTDGNAVIDAEGVVTFGNPPALPPVAADCSVSVNPSSCAGGRDAHGHDLGPALRRQRGPGSREDSDADCSRRRFDRRGHQCHDQQQRNGDVRGERLDGRIGEVHGG